VPPHPAERFSAPSAIQQGVPLKKLLGSRRVVLISEYLAEVVPGFDVRRFQTRAKRGLGKLELKERAVNNHEDQLTTARFIANTESLANRLCITRVSG
jgi:hypothetical protein